MGVIKSDRGVVGESPALLVPTVHGGDGGKWLIGLRLCCLVLRFYFCSAFRLRHCGIKTISMCGER